MRPSMTSAEIAQEYEPISCVLTSQTYGPVDPLPTRHLRRAIMHSANHGIRWEGDVSVNGWTFGAARSNAAAVTLKAVDDGIHIDYLVWVDSDQVLEVDSLTRMIRTAWKHKIDFLTGVYHYKDGTARPVLYEWVDKWWPIYATFKFCESYPPNTIAPIGGCGFGMCVTSAAMLREMKESPFWHERGKWFPDTRDSKGGFGEDLAFCKMAIECGYQLYVDTGIQVGHQGDGRVYTQKDHEEYCKQRMRESGVQV
jgi:hypothetical protein